MAKTDFVEQTGEFRYWLLLTNKEVRIVFRNMILGWFGKVGGSYNDFIKVLLINDVKAINHYMNKVAFTTFSYFDTGKQPSESELVRFCHGFVLGLMMELADR